jgi:protein tyrosine/serine phosphatase
MDHAFLRGWWTNLDEVAPGVWRSNQPSPDRFRQYRDLLGLKSVLNLRGSPRQGFYLFEVEACQRLGLTLHDVSLSARQAPPKVALLNLLDLLPRLEKPVLIHCKSGADRTGLVAALYLLEVEHLPLAAAKRHLSFRYLHLKTTSTGVLDHFLTLYEAEAGGRSLREWIEQDYDADRLTESFAALRKGRTP